MEKRKEERTFFFFSAPLSFKFYFWCLKIFLAEVVKVTLDAKKYNKKIIIHSVECLSSVDFKQHVLPQH